MSNAMLHKIPNTIAFGAGVAPAAAFGYRLSFVLGMACAATTFLADGVGVDQGISAPRNRSCGT